MVWFMILIMRGNHSHCYIIHIVNALVSSQFEILLSIKAFSLIKWALNIFAHEWSEECEQIQATIY